jgi:hypothetical protein
VKFPEVTGTNLLRRKVTLPDDLQGQINILFIAFQQWQQTSVDSWIPTARQLERTFPSVRYFEIPVIYKMNKLSQTFLNEGMRAGIPNSNTREKTITMYLDKLAFRRAVDIPNEDAIAILILDQQGNILWRTTGVYSVEKGAALLQAVQEISTRVDPIGQE